MSSSVRRVLLLWLLMLPLGINGKTHVKLQNGLEGNLDLKLHCKSKEDDLGEQHLRYEQTYEFSFKPHWFKQTQYYCSFRWQGACYWFDVYIKDRDKNFCEDCGWVVTQAGPYRNEGPGKPSYYSWKDTC